MFSLQQILGKGDRFQSMLEQAAQQAHQSVQLALDLIREPDQAGTLEALTVARREEKRIAERISHELARCFVTGLDREDIEALSLAIHKIPKTVGKFAERLLMAREQIGVVDFSPQAEMMRSATDAILDMVRQLRDMKHLERVRELNDGLQRVEGEADKLMFELLRDLYSGRHDPLRVLVRRDLYELIEKVIDRCRDAGNVVMHVVLKNS